MNLMKNGIVFFYLLALLFGFTSCQKPEQGDQLSSPSGNISIEFFLDHSKGPGYTVSYNEQLIIDSSFMGFDFKDQPALRTDLELVSVDFSALQETWEMPWGEQERVDNHYNEMKVSMKEGQMPNRNWNIYFRAYDDGVAFRYEFPEQNGVDSVVIMDENTEFSLTGDHTAWWIPGDWDIYEHLYNTTFFSEIDALSKRNHPNLAQTYIPENAVNTPVTMRTAEGLHLSFHEANLTDYAGMTLKVDPENLKMTSELVGSDRLGHKVARALPFHTPWRTIQIGKEAKDLLESRLILNLNEPNKLGDVSWFKPQKYMGIWWEMHLGKSSWDMASGKHGATTANAKKFIDFASENNIGGILVEGWNTGWEHWIGFEDREGVFDFVTPYPDYDLEAVVEYGRSKGVELIMHHETSAAPRTYEQQLDTAFALMQKHGIHVVKTGYVGKIIPKGEYHHGQWMVNHYRKVLETAAKYEVAVNAHEPIKATGIRRTLPNAIAREGLRGQEFNSWSIEGGNPAEHLSLVAFTRMLAGPIDFTPGVFDLKLTQKYLDPANMPAKKPQINTTLAHQLALYVVIYSPVQMACDLVEHYDGHPAFQFIRDVGVDWEQSVALDGEVGDYVVMARKEKGTQNWYLGAITDEEERTIEVNFDFLIAGKEYELTIYEDGKDAHWDENAGSYNIRKDKVTSERQLSFRLAPGGGLAISIKPMD
jgi:hypothetical protein